MVSTATELGLDPATDAGWSITTNVAWRTRIGLTDRFTSWFSGPGGHLPKLSIKGEQADLDVVTVSFQQSSYRVDEGEDVTVTVELDADPERELVIPLRLTEVDASNADYTGVPVSVTFPDGVTTQTFTVSAVDDIEVEDDESLSLAFGTLPAGVTAGGETTIEIGDNDVAEEDEDEEDEEETGSAGEDPVRVGGTDRAGGRGPHSNSEDERCAGS